MKTDVTVWMVARVQVKMAIEHEDGEDPADLTDQEGDRAAQLADHHVVEWDVERVTRG